jgi:hypothetical protein
MPNHKFWRLSSSNTTSRLARWLDAEMDLETVKCPVDEGHQRAGKRLTDLSIRLPGRSIEDFVWTWYNECLLQDHVLHALEAERFRGFEVRPVKARFEVDRTEGPQRLWELVVTGWGGVAPPASGIKLLEHCNACHHTVYSGFRDAERLIDKNQWDNSDFFIVWPLPKYIFITDRVAQAIRRAGWTGVQITALEDMQRPSGLSPGRLSNWMPDLRARQLGESLGIY